jgi:hypothetical protein
MNLFILQLFLAFCYFVFLRSRYFTYYLSVFIQEFKTLFGIGYFILVALPLCVINRRILSIAIIRVPWYSTFRFVGHTNTRPTVHGSHTRACEYVVLCENSYILKKPGRCVTITFCITFVTARNTLNRVLQTSMKSA